MTRVREGWMMGGWLWGTIINRPPSPSPQHTHTSTPNPTSAHKQNHHHHSELFHIIVRTAFRHHHTNPPTPYTHTNPELFRTVVRTAVEKLQAAMDKEKRPSPTVMKVLGLHSGDEEVDYARAK
jgi:hypothetical protein